jgi:hypothetical protein
MAELDALLDNAVARLVAAGARAVVLCGSHARGEGGPLSDVDVYALGSGPEYRLERAGGYLLSTSWRTPEAVRAAFADPPHCAGVVSGWREARILHDPDGLAALLQAEARAWTWAPLTGVCDAWVAEQLTGYAEEVQKLRALAPSDWYCTVLSAALGTRLPMIMTVHLRLITKTEAETWELVAAAMGDTWREAQAAALGMEAAPSGDAALALYRLAAEAVRWLLDARQAAVVFGALG